MLEITENLESKWRGLKEESSRQGTALGFQGRKKSGHFIPAPQLETHKVRQSGNPEMAALFAQPLLCMKHFVKALKTRHYSSLS